jgi:ubiquinone/menaquinone biosynthesis C-methylase UbiE
MAGTSREPSEAQHPHGAPPRRADQTGHGEHGHRTHRFDPANIARLIGEERRALLPPLETLQAAGLAPGQTVVDLGCGPGYFTLPAAELVGEHGKVYGVDVQPEMVDACRRRAAEAGATRVEVVRSDETRIPLPDAIADRVLLAFVLHEADDQHALLREVRRLLKPGGEVACIEWRKQEGPPGPPREHRLSEEEVAALAGAAGLRMIGRHSLNDYHYLLRLGAG